MAGEILVIGGGIAGLTAAIEVAETGYDVILVEKNPYLGGRVAQLNKYFPKLCPPFCGLEIFFKRIKSNPKVKFFTNAEVIKVEGEAGNFTVTVKLKPRYVNENCTACGECAKVCPIERPNEFNLGLDKTKAIYLPNEIAMPFMYVINDRYCDKCGKCVEVCKYNAIDLNETEKEMTLNVSAIVVATGWKPYDAKKLENLGYGKYKDVITNMELERMASINGPTEGKITISDGRPIESVAFVQCAGSRDENHLPFCSAVCCLASMKEATYIREQYPDAKIYIFYIDIRAFGRYEDFYNKIKEDDKIQFIKGKVAKIEKDVEKLIVIAEDTISGRKIEVPVDLVVLATGMQPSSADYKIPGIEYDEYGFVKEKEGIYPAGVAAKPLEVAGANESATAAALKAIQIVRR
uniref:CoB--CoM heterodisulfide reductase iron-sulfur subunit A n=1 Tax=Geoglobus ahangari TaxID=113653 RepID=A0A7C4WEZ0_9EURY